MVSLTPLNQPVRFSSLNLRHHALPHNDTTAGASMPSLTLIMVYRSECLGLE